MRGGFSAPTPSGADQAAVFEPRTESQCVADSPHHSEKAQVSEIREGLRRR